MAQGTVQGPLCQGRVSPSRGCDAHERRFLLLSPPMIDCSNLKRGKTQASSTTSTVLLNDIRSRESSLHPAPVVVSLFEFAKTKRTELSSDKGANDERHNHYASKHLRAK